MENELKKILYKLSKIPCFEKFFLEGGSALSIIYGISRNNSWDLDFTIEPATNIDFFVDELKNASDDIIPVSINHKGLITQVIIESRGQEFPIDLIRVSSALFQFKSREILLDNGSFYINVHTITDIICEKICCLYFRKKFNDLIDINQAFLLNKVKTSDLIEQLPFKAIAKGLDMKSLRDGLFRQRSRFTRLQRNDSSRFSLNVEEVFNRIDIILSTIMNA